MTLLNRQKVRCREINSADLAHVAKLLRIGYPDRIGTMRSRLYQPIIVHRYYRSTGMCSRSIWPVVRSHIPTRYIAANDAAWQPGKYR